MPGPRRSWGQLIGGVLCAAGIVGLVLGILLFARVGAVRGDKYKLYLITSEARGILKGSEVWLAGKKVGIVSDIDFRDPGEDRGGGRLKIELDILREYQTQIRDDSYTQIRSGGSLIGAPVVYLTPGTLAAKPIQAGSTIQSRGQVDAESFTSELALASRQFPEIIENLGKINRELKVVTATIASGADKRSAVSISRVGSRTAQLGRRALKGDGTIGLLLTDADPLPDRAERAIRRAEAVMRLVNDSSGILSRLQKDTLLAQEIKDVRNEISIVRALMTQVRGTAGRMTGDSAIVLQLKHFERELGKTIDDLKREPLRYIVF